MRESFYATAATVIPVFFLAHAVLRSVAADLLMARWRAGTCSGAGSCLRPSPPASWFPWQARSRPSWLSPGTRGRTRWA